MSTTQDRHFLNTLKDKLEKKFVFEGIECELTVRRSRRNDRFGISDFTVNLEFSKKKIDNEIFKIALAIENALIRAIFLINKNLGKKQASLTLAFPTILLPGLSHPAIRIGARYLSDGTLPVKRKDNKRKNKEIFKLWSFAHEVKRSYLNSRKKQHSQKKHHVQHVIAFLQYFEQFL